VRRAIQHMLFPSKSFNWLRHIAIALILLILINMLVIFAPNILGIFGIIGKYSTEYQISNILITVSYFDASGMHFAPDRDTFIAAPHMLRVGAATLPPEPASVSL